MSNTYNLEKKPTSFPSFAEEVHFKSEQVIEEISPIHKKKGWSSGEKPGHNVFNYLHKLTNNWIQWFDKDINSIKNDEILTDKALQNSAVTENKIANSAVTTDKIKNEAITTNKIKEVPLEKATGVLEIHTSSDTGHQYGWKETPTSGKRGMNFGNSAAFTEQTNDCFKVLSRGKSTSFATTVDAESILIESGGRGRPDKLNVNAKGIKDVSVDNDSISIKPYTIRLSGWPTEIETPISIQYPIYGFEVLRFSTIDHQSTQYRKVTDIIVRKKEVEEPERKLIWELELPKSEITSSTNPSATTIVTLWI